MRLAAPAGRQGEFTQRLNLATQSPPRRAGLNKTRSQTMKSQPPSAKRKPRPYRKLCRRTKVTFNNQRAKLEGSSGVQESELRERAVRATKQQPARPSRSDAGVAIQASWARWSSAAARLLFPARMAAKMKRTIVAVTKAVAGTANTQNTAGTEAGLSIQCAGNSCKYASAPTVGPTATAWTSLYAVLVRLARASAARAFSERTVMSAPSGMDEL